MPVERKRLRHLIKLGWTNARIGEEFKVSKQRINQLIGKDDDLKRLWDITLAKRRDVHIDRNILVQYLTDGYGPTGISHILNVTLDLVRISITHHNLHPLMKKLRKNKRKFILRLPTRFVRLFTKEQLASNNKEELDELIKHWFIWDRKVRHCKAKGSNFDVPFDSIKFPSKCPILGTSLDYTKGKKSAKNTPSFDKFIPCIGYKKGNVNIISQRANLLKNESSFSEIRKIYFYMKRRQRRFYFNPKIAALRKNAAESVT